jgi:hypothetical protein
MLVMFVLRRNDRRRARRRPLPSSRSGRRLAISRITLPRVLPLLRAPNTSVRPRHPAPRTRDRWETTPRPPDRWKTARYPPARLRQRPQHPFLHCRMLAPPSARPPVRPPTRSLARPTARPHASSAGAARHTFIPCGTPQPLTRYGGIFNASPDAAGRSCDSATPQPPPARRPRRRPRPESSVARAAAPLLPSSPPPFFSGATACCSRS